MSTNMELLPFLSTFTAVDGEIYDTWWGNIKIGVIKPYF